MCHNSVAWNQVTFNHQSTNFPLTGGHIGVNCSDCHESGFSGTTTVCSECHLENYNNSTNPSHTALSLPTNCESCHTTNPGWEPALFPIHNNFYQLLGAHSSIANNCVTCHNGNYNSTPNTCYGCHQDDYNATNNPPHQSIGFPHECESCHTQNAWSPSTFDHDNQYFPIYSGRHEGEWNLCSDCHTNPTNYSVFSCIDCHEHNQAEMDDEHEGVQGYIYNSQACYNCHPDGEDHPKFFDKNIIID
jgi:NMD protein affecting ribosome stability and mRNA decay